MPETSRFYGIIIYMETFGDRLKSLRKEKKIGQIELAKQLGVGK